MKRASKISRDKDFETEQQREDLRDRRLKRILATIVVFAFAVSVIRDGDPVNLFGPLLNWL